jgi:hypothetical protein
MQPLQPLTKPEPARRPSRTALLVRRTLVNLLIWLGLNLLTFTLTSFVVFVTFNATRLAEAEAAFTYSLLCAIPVALTVSGVTVARRVVREFKQ